MSDNFFRKQLEAFGIEQVRVVEEDIDRKRQEDFKQRKHNVIRRIMETPQGREWFAYWLDITLAFTPPFAPGKPDYSAFLSGAQAVGLLMFRDLMAAAPERYYEMVTEVNAKASNITPATDIDIFN